MSINMKNLMVLEVNMLKKMVKWMIFTGVVGLLIFGAVNRTSAKLAQEPLAEQRYLNESRGNSGGSGRDQVGDGGEQTGYQGGQNQTDDQNQRLRSEDGTETKLYSRAEEEEHVWATLAGEVISVNSELMGVLVSENELIEIEGRAWQLALEGGFAPEVGDSLDIIGFYEDAEFEAAEIRNLRSGQMIQLRDDTGRPLWSGRGAR
jgi:hypothetical protein